MQFLDESHKRHSHIVDETSFQFKKIGGSHFLSALFQNGIFSYHEYIISGSRIVISQCIDTNDN